MMYLRDALSSCWAAVGFVWNEETEQGKFAQLELTNFSQ